MIKLITIINDNNRDAYRKLFESAMADLNNGANINSLETYFSHIETLSKLEKNQNKIYGRKYTMLPLQEEYFEINANSRVITVPETFRKNGLSVQGDQVAETIYFKINRYFDAMDLNTTDIYIQWENANGDKGLAKEWVRDIETYDDYMVFGWALGGLITQVPGIVKFSVRFIKTVEENKQKVVKYSLSTLTAQALINPGLDLDIDVADDSLNNILAGNFENTTTITDSEIKIFKYVYSFDNLILEGNTNVNAQTQVISADLNAQGELELLVSAYADKGTLNYKLYKQNGTQPDPMTADKENAKDMSFKYEKTPDQSVQLDKVYYKKINDTYEIASLDEMGGVNASLKDKIYYEKYGVYTLSDANRLHSGSMTGYYYATAVCTTSDQTESSPLVSSYKVLLSPPGKATFNGEANIGAMQPGETLIADANIPANNSAEYVWSMKKYGETDFTVINTAIDSSYVPTEEANYKVAIKTTRNLDSVVSDDYVIYCVTKAPVAEDIDIPTVAASYTTGNVKVKASYTPVNPIADYSLTYQWYYLNGEDYEALPGVQTDTANLTTPGVYKCEITAIYNGLSCTVSRDIIVEE